MNNQTLEKPNDLVATPLTFGNPLKFGLDSCHKAKGKLVFLYREREIESTQSSAWTPITPYIREGPFNGALCVRELLPWPVVERRHSGGGFPLPIEAKHWQHAWSMCTQTLSMRAYMRVCIRMPKGFSWPFFFKNSLFGPKIVLFSTNTFLKTIFIWLDPKRTSGFRILISLRNGGPTHKG